MKTQHTPKAARVAVKTKILTAHLRTAEFFCEAYDLPLALLLQEQAYGQAETIVDCPFSTLERMNDQILAADTSEVDLEFCPEAHAILSRVAELLHRPLPELLHGLLDEAGFSLRCCVEEGLASEDGMHNSDLEGWADQAIAFERLAKRNKVPCSRDTAGGWESFGLSRPEERSARSALKGRAV